MTPLRIAAITGFLAVALGAFGAHGLEKLFAGLPPEIRMERLKWWHTAVEYHLAHAVVLLALSLAAPQRVWARRLFLTGILLFSGTLYVMGATGVRWLGAITPIGGTLLLAGWLALAFGRAEERR